jgi:osmoprotectant transport system permease protein
MLGAAIVIVVLALLLDGAFALLERLVVPLGVTAGRTKDVRMASSRRRAVMGTPIEEGKG